MAILLSSNANLIINNKKKNWKNFNNEALKYDSYSPAKLIENLDEIEDNLCKIKISRDQTEAI